MRLYMPGELYVTLGTTIRVVFECVLIIGLTIAADEVIRHGHVVSGILFGLAAAIGLAMTVLLASTRWCS